MNWTRHTLHSPRWTAWSRGLVHWVDADREAELLMHIDDAIQAGEPLGPGDLASIVVLALRSQGRRVVKQIPLAVAGLPVMLLYVVALGMVYETHFAAWDLMEEVPSTDSTAAFIRRATDLLWIVALPLGVLSGWRVATSVQQRRFLLPMIFVGGLIALAANAVEHATWPGDGTSALDVNLVSPYSVGLMACATFLPLAYVLIDAVERRIRRSASDPPDPASERIDNLGHRPDLLALGAALSPCLMVIISPVMWLPVFLGFVWLAPSFRLRQKAAATAVSTLGASGILVLGLPLSVPDSVTMSAAVAFLLVWGWLSTTFVRGGTAPRLVEQLRR